MRKFDGSRLVIASHNQGKIVEINSLVKPLGIEAISVSSFTSVEPDETEDTFEGNARIKAHAAAAASGLPALADDSGLMVDALHGAPGVYTADWAETENGRNFVMAMGRVYDLIKDEKQPWTAKFVSVLCLAWPDGHDEVFRGECLGHLEWPMRGEMGFGFDPIFVPQGETQTFAELDPQHKDSISHRAAAFQKFLDTCLSH